MVKTNGVNIDSSATEGTNVVAIYSYGAEVWPNTESRPVPDEYEKVNYIYGQGPDEANFYKPIEVPLPNIAGLKIFGYIKCNRPIPNDYYNTWPIGLYGSNVHFESGDVGLYARYITLVDKNIYDPHKPYYTDSGGTSIHREPTQKDKIMITKDDSGVNNETLCSQVANPVSYSIDNDVHLTILNSKYIEQNYFVYEWGSPDYIYNVFVMRDGYVLIDLVPVLRKSDSKAGLYDMINGVFYTTTAVVYYG